jgi:hypothetical protein
VAAQEVEHDLSRSNVVSRTKSDVTFNAQSPAWVGAGAIDSAASSYFAQCSVPSEPERGLQGWARAIILELRAVAVFLLL